MMADKNKTDKNKTDKNKTDKKNNEIDKWKTGSCLTGGPSRRRK